jgi:hypothetical protein
VRLGDRAASPAWEPLTGPDTMTLWAMTKALPDPGVTPVRLPIPGRTGRAFRDGALLPTDGTEVVGPHLRDWITGAGRLHGG